MASPPEAELRLTLAFQRVFRGSPSSEDQELVLLHLADSSGFYRATAPELGRDVLLFNEGARALYGRIFRYLRMSGDEINELETAARELAAQRQALAQGTNGE